MGNLKGILSLGFIIILPGMLFVAMSYLGVRHPLENTFVDKEWLFLHESENTIEALFFGYAGCSFICPDALIKLGNAVDEIKADDEEAKIGGFFIDVNAALQLNRAQEYAQFFSPNIEGINATEESLKKLQRQFKISIREDKEVEGTLLHTDHFFILKKSEGRWQIARVLANDTPKHEIKQILLKTLNN